MKDTYEFINQSGNKRLFANILANNITKEEEDTMGKYKELDIIIADFVGYTEVEGKHGQLDFDCADPVLYDNLTHECQLYIENNENYEKLSDDAKKCIDDWLTLMQDSPNCSNYDERWAEY